MRMTLDASIAELARAACLWEASAPKPGNVHPTASFVDMNYHHFVDSAEIVVSVSKGSKRILKRPRWFSGFEDREVDSRARGINTNLGIALLIVPSGWLWRSGMQQVRLETGRETCEIFKEYWELIAGT